MARNLKRSLSTILQHREINVLLRQQITNVDKQMKGGTRPILHAVREQTVKIHRVTKHLSVSNPLTPFLQSLERHTPFGLLPFHPVELRKSRLRSKEDTRAQGQVTLAENCYQAVISPVAFTGQPVQPEEVHQGPASWPPMRFAWAQPQLGRVEVSTIADFGLPGMSQESGFTYSYASGHLAAAHVVLVAQPIDLVTTAIPRITANLAYGGSGAPNDVAGYVVSVQLTVSAASAGNTVSTTATVGSIAGIGPPFFPALETLRNERFRLNAPLTANGPDVLLLTFSVSALVFQQAGSYGLAMVDMDGMTSPPGPNAYFANGGLVLPSFLVSDVNCPPILVPSIDPTV